MIREQWPNRSLEQQGGNDNLSKGQAKKKWWLRLREKIEIQKEDNGQKYHFLNILLHKY